MLKLLFLMKNCRVIILILLVGYPFFPFAQIPEPAMMDSAKTVKLIDSLNQTAFNRKNSNVSLYFILLVNAT